MYYSHKKGRERHPEKVCNSLSEIEIERHRETERQGGREAGRV